jgi:hypothetical protein
LEVRGKGQGIRRSSNPFLPILDTIIPLALSLIIIATTSYQRHPGVEQQSAYYAQTLFRSVGNRGATRYLMGGCYLDGSALVVQSGMTSLLNPTHVNITPIQVMKIPEGDDIDLLAILQALAIYAVVLLFPKDPSTRTHEDDQGLILALQDVILRIAASGLALSSELDGEQPTWYNWAYIPAKRRTILMVYFLT